MIKSYFFVFFLSCVSCPYIPPPIVYPDKELAEITIYGHYTPKNPKELENLKKKLITNKRCDRKSYPYSRCESSLNKGETVEEAIKDRYAHVGQESFTLSGGSYCYNKKKDKKSVPHHNLILKARLYDKKGNLLEEDFLRLEFPEDYDEEGRYTEYYLKKEYEEGRPKRYQIPKERHKTPEDGILELRHMLAYLPYNKAGHEIRIVRLEGGKEIVLRKLGVATQTKLRKSSVRLNNTFGRRPHWGGYNEEAECHLSSGPR